MANHSLGRLMGCLPALLLLLPSTVHAGEDALRPSMWIELSIGEPVPYEAVLDDLAKVRVIYLGERHTLQRHHDLQAKIVSDLARKGVKLVLAMEQLETFRQQFVDHYNRKQFDFDALAKASQWASRWGNYEQYKPVLEAARNAGAPVLALNAKAELVRQVARGGGVDKLPPEARKELPAEMDLKDPLYEKLLMSELQVHMAATPERLRPMVDAQIARDETMAATLAAFLNSEAGRDRTAVVVCGTGHAMYGLATVQRVRRRMPGVRDRIIVMSDSGDTQLSEQEKAQTRPAPAVTPDYRRDINRPLCDYLHVMAPAQSESPSPPPSPAPERQWLHHELKVTIHPAEHRLAVVDAITLPKNSPRELSFLLHSGLRPACPTAGVRMARQEERNEGVPVEAYKLELPPGLETLTISYEGAIHHPVIHDAKQQARGFQVTPGTIAADGVYLADDSVWYPNFGPGLVTFDLQVKLPRDWDAVSQGVRAAHERQPAGTMVQWKASEPQQPIFLVAAPLTEYVRPGRVQAMVFLRTPDQALAEKYLEATGRYIAMYDRLLGPYPYQKFALVENFCETGFGMPSFTLLGPTVVRLPFIVNTSYPHEILHNWWGNGVYVDHERGNWCEGLTAYLADHLLKEQQGRGIEYRVGTLQKYTDYVRGNRDFPLTQFRSRHDPSTEAVGYGKALMVYHMLRRELGDEAFKKGLREFYLKYKFRRAAFDDLRTTFEAASGKDLKHRFEQWIARTGAPELKVGKAAVRPEGSGYVLTALLEQKQAGEAYRLAVPVAVTLKGQSPAVQTTAEMHDKTLELKLVLPAPPLRLDIDPEFDLFRRLDRDEVPPAVSHGLGAKKMLIVLPAKADERALQAWRTFAQSMARSGPDEVDTKLDSEIPELPTDRAVMIVGWKNRYAATVVKSLAGYDLAVNQESVRIDKSATPRKDHCFVLTSRLPKNRDMALCLIAADRPDALPGLATKLPHYQGCSYLAFSGPEPVNVVKGRWPVIASPMTVLLPTSGEGTARVEMGALAPREPLTPAAEASNTPAPSPQAPHRASLGTIPDFGFSGKGFRLSGTSPGSPAEKAGLKPGDVIVKINDTAVENPMDVSNVLTGLKPGDKVSITYQRGEKQFTAAAVLGQR